MESVFPYITESSAELLPVFGAVFVITYLLYRRRNVSDSDVKLPPALRSLPIIGSLPFLATSMEDLVKFSISPRNKLGKIYSFCLGTE